jgi:hypothetical protein
MGLDLHAAAHALEGPDYARHTVFAPHSPYGEDFAQSVWHMLMVHFSPYVLCWPGALTPAAGGQGHAGGIARASASRRRAPRRPSGGRQAGESLQRACVRPAASLRC